MITHLGHYNTSGTRTAVRFPFSTHAQAGGNVAPSSAFEAADVLIYRAADSSAISATQRSSSSGVTMTSPFDSLTGLHAINIDLTDDTDTGFYASGYTYFVVLSPDETVDSQTLTGVVLGMFEIGPQAVNVSQFGGAVGTFASGIPEVKVASIAANAITATSIAADAITDAKVASDVTIASVTGSVGSVTGNVGGNVTGSVGSVASGGITSGSFAADAIDAAAIATDAIGALELAAGAASEIATAVRTELATELGRIDVATSTRASQTSVDTIDGNLATVAGYIDTEIGTIITNLATVDTVVDAIKATTDKIDDTIISTSDGYVFSGISLQAVWDEPIAGHLDSGTTGAALNAAGSAGDPWSTPLPGAYGAGTAGYLIDAISDAAAAIQAQTDVMTFDSDGRIRVDADEVSAAVWSEALPGSFDPGMAGAVLYDMSGLMTTIGTTAAALQTTIEETSDGWAFTANALEFAPTGGLDAAGMRSALGMSSANLDTQLSGIDAKTTNLPSDPADQSLVIAATTAIYDRIGAPAGSSVSDDIAAVKTQTGAIETDTQDIQTRLPAALVSGRIDASVGAMQNDVVTAASIAANAVDASALATDAVAEIADAVWDEAVSGHTTSGTFGKALDDADTRGARTVIRATADTGSSATSIVTSAITAAGAVADQFKGRIVLFDIDTATAALRGQATDITASSNSATPTLTVTALTTAPSSGDTFSIV